MGCGKTILSSTTIGHLEKNVNISRVLYFYFDFKDTNKQTLESMVRSLISQLFNRDEQTWPKLIPHYSKSDRQSTPSLRLLCGVLLQMIEQVKEVWIILDALDECTTREGESKVGLLSWMEEVRNLEKGNVHLLATSRSSSDIESRVSKFPEANVVPIQENFTTADIRTYIRARFDRDERLRKWRNNNALREKVEATLTEKGSGM